MKNWLLLFFLISITVSAQDDVPAAGSDLLIKKVIISPSQITLAPGARVFFDFIALDKDSKRIPAAFSWKFGGGKLHHNGLFIAGERPGKYTLEAEISTGIKGTAQITVRNAKLEDKQITSLEIIPPIATLKPGESKRFTFAAKNRYGKKLSPALGLSFSGGQMKADGTYTAGKRPGKYQIKVSASSMSAIATIHIETNTTSASGVPVKVVITPGKIKLKPGEKCKFNFSVYDALGKNAPSSLAISIGGGKLDAKGFFIAGKVPGEYQLKITADNGIVGVAKITIVSASGKKSETKTTTKVVKSNANAAKLAIIPEFAKLKSGEKCTFRFVAYDTNGKQTSLPKMGIQFMGGKLNNKGVFTAGTTPGKYQLVAATKSGLKAVATVHIYSDKVAIPEKKGSPKIEIIPQRIRLRPGQSHKFKFKLSNLTQKTVANLSWSYHGGILKPDGTFTAGMAPAQYYLSLKGPDGVGATAIVAIIPNLPEKADPYWLYITPTRIELKPGQSFQFSCKVTDDHGNKLDTRHIKWTCIGGSIDSNTLVFQAGQEQGDFYLVAEFSKYVTARAHIVIKGK